MDNYGTFMLPELARVRCCIGLSAMAKVFVLELKPGGFTVSDLVNDLQAGSGTALEWVMAQPAWTNVEASPVDWSEVAN